MGQDQGGVSVFLCGGDLCKDGKPHEWDGPELTGETEGGGGFSTGTCSKCGMSHMSWSMFHLDEHWTVYERILEDSLGKDLV
jgi:hypothetical protein